MSLIPHQLGLTHNQIKNLIKGKPVNIPHHQMGSEAGEAIMMLHPHNAKKLLSSYKKGKGVRVGLTPDEIHHSIHHGRGFFDFAKKAFHTVANVADKALENPIVRDVAKKGVHYGVDAIGTAVGTFLGNPVAGAMIGDAIGSAAERAIDNRNVKSIGKNLSTNATEAGSQIAQKEIEKQIEKLPESYRGVAKQAVKKTHKEIFGFGAKKGCGVRPPKGSPEMKEYMAKIRSMRKGKGLYGGGVFDDIGKAFKSTFTPDLGRKIATPLIHKALPAVVAGTTGALVGTATGNPVAGILAGQTVGKYAGKKAGDALGDKVGLGVKRGRGRPKKGTGVLSSTAYKNAMKFGKMTYGVELNTVKDSNEPINKFHTDPRVKPSTTEMTLSPYQSINSPAMNPFVPKSYQQEGGQSAGYGEATPHTNLYGYGLY